MKQVLFLALFLALYSCESPEYSQRFQVSLKSNEIEIGDTIDVLEYVEETKEYRTFPVKVICKVPTRDGWEGIGQDFDGGYWILEHKNGITYATRWKYTFPPAC
jgi:hypothetical protein